MLAKEILQIAMRKRGHNFTTLSKKLGYSKPNVLSQKLDTKGRCEIKLGAVLEIADALDCEVVIRSKGADRAEWVITDVTEQKHPEIAEKERAAWADFKEATKPVAQRKREAQEAQIAANFVSKAEFEELKGLLLQLVNKNGGEG